jgi:hypothetical protein
VPNYLDLLRALDEFTRDSSAGYVHGSDVFGVAASAGLAAWGDAQPASWMGQLQDLGYVEHGPLSGGDRAAIPRGALWTHSDLQRFTYFHVTPRGREEADRMRRLERERGTDAALGVVWPDLVRPWMSDAQTRAITVPLKTLVTSLDSEHGGSAIGAAKDLLEAACKLTIEHAGATAPPRAPLPALFAHAIEARPLGDAAGRKVARSLAATVQALAELRNEAGSGHGRVEAPVVPVGAARLAASAGVAVAAFLLGTDDAADG